MGRGCWPKCHTYASGGALPMQVGAVLSFLVTAQLPRRAYDSRREAATSGIGRRSASMILHPCFLAVERKERIVAKSAAPSEERKPPEIFCRSFIMRPSRSASLLLKGTAG